MAEKIIDSITGIRRLLINKYSRIIDEFENDTSFNPTFNNSNNCFYCMTYCEKNLMGDIKNRALKIKNKRHIKINDAGNIFFSDQLGQKLQQEFNSIFFICDLQSPTIFKYAIISDKEFVDNFNLNREKILIEQEAELLSKSFSNNKSVKRHRL